MKSRKQNKVRFKKKSKNNMNYNGQSDLGPSYSSNTSNDTQASDQPNPDYPNLVRSEGKIWKKTTVDNFEFLDEVPIPMVEKTVRWVGSKIPLSLWDKVLAFFELSYKRTKSESQVRLFLNSETGVWKVWAFPQFSGTGMTTLEIADHPRRAAQDEAIGAGFRTFGTIHHHCSGSAFQSSVDKNNEQNQNGIHITVGHIGKDEYDLHGRIVIRGQQHAIVWSQWFEMPEFIDEEIEKISEHLNSFADYKSIFPIPGNWETNMEKLKIKFLENALKTPPEGEVEIPDEWMENLIPENRGNGGGYIGRTHSAFPDHGGGKHGHGFKSTTSYPKKNVVDLPNTTNVEDQMMVDAILELGDKMSITPVRITGLVEGIIDLKQWGTVERIPNHERFRQPNDIKEAGFVDAVPKLVYEHKGTMGVAYSLILDAVTEMKEAAIRRHDESSYWHPEG